MFSELFIVILNNSGCWPRLDSRIPKLARTNNFPILVCDFQPLQHFYSLFSFLGGIVCANVHFLTLHTNCKNCQTLKCSSFGACTCLPADNVVSLIMVLRCGGAHWKAIKWVYHGSVGVFIGVQESCTQYRTHTVNSFGSNGLDRERKGSFSLAFISWNIGLHNGRYVRIMVEIRQYPHTQRWLMFYKALAFLRS